MPRSRVDSLPESPTISDLRSWAEEYGAFIHPSLTFVKDPTGTSVHAIEDLPPDTTVLSCPFSLAITPSQSHSALSAVIRTQQKTSRAVDRTITDLRGWNERQLICSYIVMHWILLDQKSRPGHDPNPLAHLPYLNSLPSTSALLTPLHFSPAELAALKGTNLYSAAVERKRDWESEWETCRTSLKFCSPQWAEAFTWEKYLLASTYLSSRAFPSTLLSASPSITSSDSSHPVLLPVVDSLNHARAHGVSWIVTGSTTVHSNISPNTPALQINLVMHAPTPSGSEVYNNYGAKPNSELLLAYGFVIPDNPDDTIVLKIVGSEKRWEVGREAAGVENVWNEVMERLRDKFVPEEEEEEDLYEWEWKAANALEKMASNMVEKLPDVTRLRSVDIRPQVKAMIDHYVQGQSDILFSIVEYAERRREEALSAAKAAGIDVTIDDDDSTA